MKYKQNQAVAYRVIDGEAVLLKDVTMLSLNETGTFIWKILEEESLTEEEITKRLVEEYDISFEEALNDVKLFLEELEKRGMILKIE